MTGYLQTLLLFYRRNLRVQPLRELMAILGVAAGVALLFAVQVAHQSVTGSFAEITSGVAGHATIEVSSRGPQGFAETVAEEVGAMPDVRAAAPIFEQPVVIVGPNGRRALRLLGATEQLASLGGSLSKQFARAGESAKRGALLLAEPTARAIGARPGRRVTVLLGARSERLTLAAVVASAKIGALADSPIAAAPLPIVQSLAGQQQRITRVLVEAQPGRERALRATLTRRFGMTLNVRPVSAEAQLLANAAGPEKQVTLLFSAISLVAGMILAYNALLLASDERRRFIANLIRTGTPESMIVASLAFDAFVMGVAGCVLGLIAGDVISLIAFRSVPGYIAAAFALGGQRVVGAQTVLIAVAGGMLAAFVAALLPSLVALRAGATAEPERVRSAVLLARRLRVLDWLRFACGATLVCFSIAISVLFPATTVVALVGLATGLVVCLPTILRGALKLGHAASRRSSDPSVPTSLAELRSTPARSVALLATGTIAVFLVVLISGSVADVQRAARTGAGDLLSSANLWVKPGGSENVYTTQPFASEEIEHRLRHLGVVASVAPWRDSFLDLPTRRVWVVGVPVQTSAQIAPSQLVAGNLKEADEKLRRGGWVAVSQPIARERHLRVGDRITLPTPSGAARPRIAATIANYGWLPGAIVMNATEHARLWNSEAATELAVTLRPGGSLARGKAAVERILPNAALAVQSPDGRRSEVSAVLGSTLSRLSDTTLVVLIATVFSVIALMLSAIWQRREKLALMISEGWSFGQLARLIFLESGSVLLGGGLIGMAAGLIGQYLIDGWLQQSTGASVTFVPAWQLGLRTLAIAAAISLLATLVAVTRTTRFQVQAVISGDRTSSATE
jgi:putative ABC transport system permease protein